MKYLKSFNEELSPQIYRTVARRILAKNKNNPALIKRSNDLKSHGEFINNKMSMISWKKRIDEYSKYGLINIISECESGTIQENFYFDLAFEKDCMVDAYTRDLIEIPFFIGLIPPNEDVLNKCLEIFPEPDFSGGYFWAFNLIIEVKVSDDNYILHDIEIYPYDEGLTGNTHLSNRRAALNIKNSLLEVFTKDYPSGYRNHKYTKQVIEEAVDELNMSHEVFDVVVDGLKIFDWNKLL